MVYSKKLNLGIIQLLSNFGPPNAKHKEIYKGYQDKLHTGGRLRTICIPTYSGAFPKNGKAFLF
jgi:hypothetical protein